MKKKYLFLMITEGFAGAEHFLINYFRYIDYDKYSVTLGVKTDLFGLHLEKNNLPVEIAYLPVRDGQSGFFQRLAKYYIFFSAIRPHCIVFNQFWLESFGLPEIIAASLFTRGNAYMIVHDCPPVHPGNARKLHFGFLPGLGLTWRKKRLRQTLLGYFTRATLAVSKASNDILVKCHNFPQSRVKMVYHGVDIHTYSPSRENRVKLRHELKIPDTDSIIVSTAMLGPVKRIDRLLQAFVILAQERKDIWLLVAGSGSEYRQLTGMVESLDEDIRSRIRFLGYREDVPLLLQSSDIYVLPSDTEGLPLACLEAMSCGLISVVTNCGGTGEIIQDGYNGFLVERSHVGVLNGLKRALKLSAAEKEQISQNGRNVVKDKFNLENNIRFGLKVLKLSDG
jgi:glycosyltransferase involved in cell wall biosynthesis